MAAIGAIRKHGVLLLIIIGVALLAFLLGDFTQLTTVFSDKNTMIKINNNKIDQEYNLQYEQNLALWKLFYKKNSLEETEMYQIHEMTWNQMLEDLLLDEQLKALGLIFTDEMKETLNEEMIASLRTQQPNQLLAQFVNVIAEEVGAENAISFISTIEDYRDNENARELYNAYKAIERFAISDKKRANYFTLAQNTLYFSNPLAEQLVNDNQTALVQLISINPTNQAFAEIQGTVSEKEMKSWYKEHADNYKIKENLRDIDVAIFPVTPTPQDLQNIEDTVRAAFQRFVDAPSITAYNFSEMRPPMDSTYYKKDDIIIESLDSLIFNLPVGTIIEPFSYENVKWYFGKTYGVAHRPDSLLLAYLVVDFKSAQNPEGTRTAQAAKLEADSLKNLIASAQASIFTLLPNYLAGRNTTDTTLWVPERGTIPTLYDTLMKTPNGGLFIHESTNAYVVYQVLSRTTPVEKRQFVIYDFDIKASDATIKALRANANQLAAECSNADEFIDIANSKGIQMLRGTDIKSMSASIGQLNNCRDIVSWAFSETTEKDDISDVMSINNNSFYAVAALRAIKNKGIPKFQDVKATIEQELLATKKVELIETKIKEELAKGTSPADLAAKYGSSVMDSVTLSFLGENYQNRNVENIAIARLFKLPADNKPQVVAGNNNVYIVSINHFDKIPASDKLITEKNILRSLTVGRSRNEITIMEGLKDQADILDRRYFYYAR